MIDHKKLQEIYQMALELNDCYIASYYWSKTGTFEFGYSISRDPCTLINSIDEMHEVLTKLTHDNYEPNFTQEQKNFICNQIGEWYLSMKPLLEGQHNLGYMKEKLKLMVCDDE